MNSKTLIMSNVIALAFLSCNNTEQISKDPVSDKKEFEFNTISHCYSVDPNKSLLNWKGTMIGMYFHTGAVKITDGTLKIKNNVITEGNFTIDLTQIYTTDSDELYKTASRVMLITHLLSDDFFSTIKYPTASFIIKKQAGSVIIGDLTIKGITHEESFTNIKISEAEGVVTAFGNLVFDRKKYGINYNSKLGDLVISDDIEINFSISALAI